MTGKIKYQGEDH